jgi:small subunit ribosomal protein S1
MCSQIYKTGVYVHMDQNSSLVEQEAKPEENQELEQPEEEAKNASDASMEALLQEEGLELNLPKSGDIRTGVIASVGESEILVSVGAKSEGVITGRELDQIPKDEFESFEIGQEIPVFVVTPEDQGGNLVLSYTRAREEGDWKNAEGLLASEEPYEGEIIGYNKGGLIVPIGSVRGFVPASQVSVFRRSEISGETPDQRWGAMVGESIIVQVIEVDRQRHRLILSERAALQETRESIKDRLLDELHEGDVRRGRVTSLADFGAFVNIDGADGLVHLSEISWERIGHPNEVLKVGQEVDVKIIVVDRDKKRIGLSIRQLLPDPWLKKVDGIREGQLVEASITHLTKFGAFARLSGTDDLEGLVHISELSESRINHPKEVVNEGDVVTLRVIRIDTERRRIGLSLRKVDSPAYADLDWKMALYDEIEEAGLDGELVPEEAMEEIPIAEGEEEIPEVVFGDTAPEIVGEEIEDEVELEAEEVTQDEVSAPVELEEIVEAEIDVVFEEIEPETGATVEEEIKELEIAEIAVEEEPEDSVEVETEAVLDMEVEEEVPTPEIEAVPEDSEEGEAEAAEDEKLEEEVPTSEIEAEPEDSVEVETEAVLDMEVEEEVPTPEIEALPEDSEEGEAEAAEDEKLEEEVPTSEIEAEPEDSLEEETDTSQGTEVEQVEEELVETDDSPEDDESPDVSESIASELTENEEDSEETDAIDEDDQPEAEETN